MRPALVPLLPRWVPMAVLLGHVALATCVGVFLGAAVVITCCDEMGWTP